MRLHQDHVPVIDEDNVRIDYISVLSNAIDLGFDAIGRPNCNSCVDMTARFVKGREVVIIGDNDEVGKTGAEKLAGKLLLHCSSVKVIYPPGKTKDLRQWLQAGLTSGQLQQIIEKEKELQIKISFKD